MDGLHDLLGTDFTCEACGKQHSNTVEEVIFAEDAVEQLPDVCRRHAGGHRVNLIADTRTYEAGGRQATDALRGRGMTVTEVVVPDPAPGHSPGCDDATRTWIEERLADADLFLAVGGGVINDTTKWISGERHIPYVVLGTAASMNGYPSTNLSPIINGVKTLRYGRAPVAILAVPSTLAAAPAELTSAGLGDVLPRCVSTTDWWVSHLIFGVDYCSFCAGLIDDIEPLYLTQPEKLRDGDAAVTKALFDALILTGLSMGMAGTPAPASGGEHLVSHTIDMKCMVDGRHHDLHGRQVGIGVILAAALYEEMLALDAPDLRDEPDVTDAGYWGLFTDGVEGEHARKRKVSAAAVDILTQDAAKWDEIRESVKARVLPPATIKDCLRRAGAAHCLADIGVTRDEFKQALLRAHQIRDRYTVLDLARAVGVLPGRADELIDKWVA